MLGIELRLAKFWQTLAQVEINVLTAGVSENLYYRPRNAVSPAQGPLQRAGVRIAVGELVGSGNPVGCWNWTYLNSVQGKYLLCCIAWPHI